MIIFLYGEDEFRSQEKLGEIRKKFLEKNSSGPGPSSFDFGEDKNIQLSQIKEAFNSKSLFGEKQLIIVKNLLSEAPKNITQGILIFLKSLKDIAEDKNSVIVFWEKGKINEKSELFKFLIKNSKSQKFGVLSGVKLSQWIFFKLHEANDKVSLSPKAAEKLAAYANGDLFNLSNEILKLASFKNSGAISEEDIELLVKEKVSTNIFEAIEALSSGNKKTALKLFHDQLQKGEDPLYILAMYVYQFRNFLKVGEYYFEGERNSEALSRKTGIHPFVARKILGQIHRFSLDKLKDIHKRLQKIDERAKTGKGDVKVELDRFIVEI
jgi:DNA polymerase-3 subunit delta